MHTLFIVDACSVRFILFCCIKFVTLLLTFLFFCTTSRPEIKSCGGLFSSSKETSVPERKSNCQPFFNCVCF